MDVQTTQHHSLSLLLSPSCAALPLTFESQLILFTWVCLWTLFSSTASLVYSIALNCCSWTGGLDIHQWQLIEPWYLISSSLAPLKGHLSFSGLFVFHLNVESDCNVHENHPRIWMQIALTLYCNSRETWWLYSIEFSSSWYVPPLFRSSLMSFNNVILFSVKELHVLRYTNP